jgi:hypothetical protein
MRTWAIRIMGSGSYGVQQKNQDEVPNSRIN